MQKLTKLEKTVFTRAYFGLGQSPEQIAQDLQIPVSKVHKLWDSAEKKAQENNGAIDTIAIPIPYGLTPETLNPDQVTKSTPIETPLQWFLGELALYPNEQDRTDLIAQFERICTFAVCLKQAKPANTFAECLESGIIAERG